MFFLDSRSHILSYDYVHWTALLEYQHSSRPSTGWHGTIVSTTRL